LWTEPTVARHGRFFSFDEVMFEPKPVQPGGPPIHVGGDGKAALRRVARFGDGWLPMNHTVDMLPASLRTLDELWAEHGRRGRPQVTMSYAVSSRDDVKRLADAGLDRVIVDPWQRTSGALDGIARFADEIMSKM
jgi:alkanesulfonate monooxygenase SsuD/methylene tetrahydromethanopterin reductase-like flavin-dependent oxidoreductase (luciferase family)